MFGSHGVYVFIFGFFSQDVGFFTSGLSLICRYEGRVTLDELLITLVFCHHTFVSGVWMGFVLFLKVSSLFLVRFFLARLASF